MINMQHRWPISIYENYWRMSAVVVVLLGCCQTGCVARRLTILSNPPGALVYIDDVEIGTTPISTHYTYYGTRKIRMVKAGYETLTVMQPIGSPWWDNYLTEFFSENLVPGELRDHRIFSFDLKPQQIVPPAELLSRAQELRRNSAIPPAETAPREYTTPLTSSPVYPATTPGLNPPGYSPLAPGVNNTILPGQIPAGEPSRAGGQPVYLPPTSVPFNGPPVSPGF